VRSHLLEGTLRHRRSRPFVYELDHSVFYFALDMDELDRVASKLRLVSRNRRNVLEFRDDDHLLPPYGPDLARSIREHLVAESAASAASGASGSLPAPFDSDEVAGWHITLVTNLRMFGHIFNPASFYLCRDRAGAMRAVVVEVTNTHHERRLYTLWPERLGDEHRASMAKDFYVSPFIDMDARYTVRVWDRPAELRIAINETEHGEPTLTASLVLRRLPLSNRAVARMLARYPFVTLKTIVAIHWHALRLYLKGGRFHHHQASPERST
jgi:DUF1365 family protein